ncbi:MAG: hypothetical protein JXD22_17300 [Sedimentisphaerales bacterium]|nr:hypothetical protein [Sedimentisphaerales bacterium]
MTENQEEYNGFIGQSWEPEPEPSGNRGKLIFLIALILIAVGIIFIIYKKNSGPGTVLEALKFYRTTRLPGWQPLSSGFPEKTELDQIYLTMAKKRYLIMIVSVPARILQTAPANTELNQQNPGNSWTNRDFYDTRYYPDFSLKFEDGSEIIPHRITAWPKNKNACILKHFLTNNWYPSASDEPEKRIYLALMWDTIEGRTTGPFDLTMNDEHTIHVPASLKSANIWKEN